MTNLPKDFQHPGGFVEEVMNYINDTAVCEQPMFALAAALTLTGILIGRKAEADDGTRSNLYVMAIGASSSGKNQPLKAIADLLDAGGLSHHRLGQICSDSALEWALKREPCLAILLDEAGHFFGNCSETNSPGSPQRTIKPSLLEIWSCANSRWVGKQRVPKDGKTELPPLVIDHPHVCLYATSQPEILLENISRQDLHDGWLARNLFFFSKTRPKPVFKMKKEIPNSIRGFLYQYRDWEKQEDGSERNAVTVSTTEEAHEVFAAFNDKVYELMVRADKTGKETNYLRGKQVENARRIALILAVSRAPDLYRSKIEKCDAEYACKLVDFLVSEMIREVEDALAENFQEKVKKRIRKLIASAGASGISRNELTRKTQFARRSMRDECLEDLIEGEEIVAREISYGGIMYYLRDFCVNAS